MSRRALQVFAASGALAAVVSITPRGEACGGCFHEPGPPTQVSAHRMAFAITPTRTILWDQVVYSGAPTSFGWVLPIRGVVDVGVSTDAFFTALDNQTQAVVTAPPPPVCPPTHDVCRTTCPDPCAEAFDASTGGFKEDAAPRHDAPSVEVWGTGVVGPYEATELSATDSTALKTWLTDHGYVLPPAIAPVVDAYIAEGFGFLAIKLVPGEGDSRMVPIRIAFDGASPSLPLRMVAAGTGAQVGIKLFVLGEGRWETQNFDDAEIATKDLVWDWSYGGSNFTQLENNLFSAHTNGVFVTESSEEDDLATFTVASPPPPPVDATADGSDGGDGGTSIFSSASDADELKRAFPTRTTAVVTRMLAQLPASALASDLLLQASSGGAIPSTRQAPTGINYVCPSDRIVDCPGVSPPCSGICEHPYDPNFPANNDSGDGGGCDVAPVFGSSATCIGGAVTIAAALGAIRRRRRRA
jgi:hypothetical protein